MTRRTLVGCAALLLAAATLRALVAFGLPNIYWADEIFQSLEQAHRAAFGYGMIPWEYREGTRSWLLPGVLAGVMRLTSGLGEGSAGYLAAIKALLCLLSLSVPLTAFLWARRLLDGGDDKPRATLGWALLAALPAVIWFELVFFAGKALTEVVATHLLLPGCYLLATATDGGRRGRRPLVAGLLLGLAVALRMHLAPAVLVIGVIGCWRAGRARLLPALAGGGLALLIAGALDAATWSYPFSSFVDNFRVNVIEGKAAGSYGSKPAAQYFEWLASLWFYWALPMAGLALLAWRRLPGLVFGALALVATHSAIGHKEYRFIYPAVALIVVAAGIEGATRLARLAAREGGRRWPIPTLVALIAFGWCCASLHGASRFTSDRTSLKPSREQAASHWHRYAGRLQAFEALSRREGLCGVGFTVRWVWTGGYAYLHRDVPLVPARGVAPATLARWVNVALLPGNEGPTYGPFRRERCWPGACLYSRPGRDCRLPSPGYHVNKVLEASGI